jgi:hypothetical protein
MGVPAATNDRITESSGYVRVDFGSCNSAELSEVYQAFAAVCVDRHVNRALLMAGDDEPLGHHLLRTAINVMGRRAPIPPDFKLALIPSTAAVAAVYREAQEYLRADGLNAWVFDSESEATEWLEGRAVSGVTAS